MEAIILRCDIPTTVREINDGTRTEILTGDLRVTIPKGRIEAAIAQIGILQAMVIVEEGKVADLQAVVYKLPVLADDTYWIPGRDYLWHPEAMPGNIGLHMMWNGHEWYAGDSVVWWPASECYRTEAEARVVAEAKNSK